MSTAIIIDPREIQQIRHRTINSSRFTMLGRKIHRLAKVVKQEWENFSLEDRETLKKLAYDLIEPSSRLSSLWLKLWDKVYMVFIKVTRQEQALYFCLDALDCLIDNILDAIERENADYQQVLSDTLEELSSNPGVGEPVDADTRGKWLQQLSDKALKEV